MSAFEDAAREMVTVFVDSGALADLGPHLTCSEAEIMADMFRAADEKQWAEELIDSHAAADEEGDSHYRRAG